MKQQNKFNPELEQELAKNLTAQNSAHEFANVEELLRHDAARTSAPASIEQRLQKSTADFPKPPKSWWKRLFG
ncbi:MAG TPA: hypothetical protein VN873_04045 [Candidatus Angelobacter sp.]|nr:hypothetical protein [Candidatus Angelobacter sp.]